MILAKLCYKTKKRLCYMSEETDLQTLVSYAAEIFNCHTIKAVVPEFRRCAECESGIAMVQVKLNDVRCMECAEKEELEFIGGVECKSILRFIFFDDTSIVPNKYIKAIIQI